EGKGAVRGELVGGFVGDHRAEAVPDHHSGVGGEGSADLVQGVFVEVGVGEVEHDPSKEFVQLPGGGQPGGGGPGGAVQRGDGAGGCGADSLGVAGVAGQGM